MTKGLFITFEGTEGCGKTTQTNLLANRLSSLGYRCRLLREPGGTPIGEEIRHTLKHSVQNHAMTAEAELLLMNASRAQLVREIIQPALAAGEIVICDRFYDSTVAYQGYGRGLDLDSVGRIIALAVGPVRPDVTILLTVPVEVSEARRQSRQSATSQERDRMEEAGRSFFLQVERGYEMIAAAEPERVRRVDAARSVDEVQVDIWGEIQPHLARLSLRHKA